MIDFLSEPGELGYRVRLVFFLSAAVLSAPLVAFAVYLWSLGAKVLRERQLPPPGYRVIRDSPVIGGQAAVLRGRRLKVLAVCPRDCLCTVGAVAWAARLGAK